MVHKGIRVCGPGTGHHKGSTIAAIPYTLQEVNSVTNLQTVVEEKHFPPPAYRGHFKHT